MANGFIMPGKIISGSGALDQAGEQFQKMGSRALIVTDQMMRQLGTLDKVTAVLEKNGVAYSVFDGVSGEPTDVMVNEGLQAYKKDGCDFLIALGGGSPIDSMKAVAALSVTDEEISDFFGKEIEGNLPPMAAIPTTAGTGSEATRFTIITDTKKDVKMLLRGDVLMPDLAIVDPRFTITAPPKTTAATGLDVNPIMLHIAPRLRQHTACGQLRGCGKGLSAPACAGISHQRQYFGKAIFVKIILGKFSLKSFRHHPIAVVKR